MPASWDALLACGSSPRGRGKPHRSRRFELHAGLIPARAGKTTTSTPSRPTLRAHPRAGGENGGHGHDAACARGSSPRGRGKQTRDEREPFFPRLIPARAGKTDPSLCGVTKCAAHPRAGGENIARAPAFVNTRGSSPRGRGKHLSGAQRAGSCLAHPRAGGENWGSRYGYPTHMGSSPRGRGKRLGGPRTHRR